MSDELDEERNFRIGLLFDNNPDNDCVTDNEQEPLNLGHTMNDHRSNRREISHFRLGLLALQNKVPMTIDEDASIANVESAENEYIPSLPSVELGSSHWSSSITYQYYDTSPKGKT
jgi:hypothetical protein